MRTLARVFLTRNHQRATADFQIFSLLDARKIIDDIFLRLYSAALKGGINAMAKKKATKKTTKKTTKKKSR